MNINDWLDEPTHELPPDLRAIDEAASRLGAHARHETPAGLAERIAMRTLPALHGEPAADVVARIETIRAERAVWGFWRAAAAIGLIAGAAALVSQWRGAGAPPDSHVAQQEAALSEVDEWLTSFDESSLFVRTDLDALRDDVAGLDADDAWTLDDLWITSEGDAL